MKANEYQDLAMRTSPPVNDPLDSLLFALVGMAGESGEALDLMKKVTWHGHTLDREKMIREIGDVQWYIAKAATALGISLEEVMVTNIKKLEARYPNGFTTELSVNRKPGDT